MATNNSVNVGLSGSTGTGNFVGANTPTLITPVLGAATGTSIAFSPTTGGIIGTTTNDNAGAGKVGEYVSSQVLAASAVSCTNNTARDVTSISLTAGDWDVDSNTYFVINATGATEVIGWTNSASATLVDGSLYSAQQLLSSVSTSISQANLRRRYSLSGTTTIYLSVYATGTFTTVTAAGFISARRVR